jgi:hypothetical protein
MLNQQSVAQVSSHDITVVARSEAVRALPEFMAELSVPVGWPSTGGGVYVVVMVSPLWLEIDTASADASAPEEVRRGQPGLSRSHTERGASYCGVGRQNPTQIPQNLPGSQAASHGSVSVVQNSNEAQSALLTQIAGSLYGIPVCVSSSTRDSSALGGAAAAAEPFKANRAMDSMTR